MNKTLINNYRLDLFIKVNSASCNYFSKNKSGAFNVTDYLFYYLLDGYYNYDKLF